MKKEKKQIVLNGSLLRPLSVPNTEATPISISLSNTIMLNDGNMTNSHICIYKKSVII